MSRTGAIRIHSVATLSAMLLLLSACTGTVETTPAPVRPAPGPTPEISCPMVYDPVCASNGRQSRTFGNVCEAGVAGWRVVARGECRGGGGPQPVSPFPLEGQPMRPPVAGCTREFRPVCAVIRQRPETYPNRCSAEAAGARVVGEGEC